MKAKRTYRLERRSRRTIRRKPRRRRPVSIVIPSRKSHLGRTIFRECFQTILVFSLGQNVKPLQKATQPRLRTPLLNSRLTFRYNHIVISNLMNPTLLSSVRDEILTHLHFTPKQTDIYSVSQTGDLANLTGLPSSELASLPSLLKLRNALYSHEFRDFLCAVTGIKTDMSINSYEKGGYLLTHDDVIGTRSVSFILYLVQGDTEGGWKDEW